jgi:beta-alanine degradation protein BauB
MMTRMFFAAVLAAVAAAGARLPIQADPKGPALQAAAAGTTRIPQFENEHVKVWKSVIVPNAPLTLHRHEHGRTIVALVGGDLKIVKESGQTTVAHWETGKAYWLPPDPPGEMHKDINDTGKTIEVMVVEMK